MLFRIGDYICEAIYSKVMSLAPRNYSKFAYSQYMKNANITPNQIRKKLKNQINLYAKSANIVNFLVNSLRAIYDTARVFMGTMKYLIQEARYAINPWHKHSKTDLSGPDLENPFRW